MFFLCSIKSGCVLRSHLPESAVWSCEHSSYSFCQASGASPQLLSTEPFSWLPVHFETSFLISFLSIGFNSVLLTFCICVAFSTVQLLIGFIVLSETTLNDANLLALFRAVLWPWRTFPVHLKAPRFCFLWREYTVYPCWVCWSTVPSTSAAFLSTFRVSDHC